MLNPRRFSFGGTAAIVTSMGLIIGLGAAGAEMAAIVSGLLIVGFADNLTDSLSIHMYQEAEKLEGRAAFRATLTNFVTRALVALSFVAIVLTLPKPYAGIVALAWGCALLAAITYVLARARGIGPVPEVVKHLGVAVLVIGASRGIGLWIMHHVH
jgi:VIT1/CCC1 family predicted Fe2+/Mn2+ transporter